MKRNSLPERIGAALRRRREAQEISQEDFAELVDMHRTYYSAIERGKKNMRLETLERICTALRSRMWEVLKEADAT
ncbi:MAG TPA: helix-turn-helix transcriptional regulator [Gammaproteobacteria bacterium]|nr:helix-turn-helix transcriptional regulator [Gammaproteobacteria bacterium]